MSIASYVVIAFYLTFYNVSKRRNRTAILVPILFLFILCVLIWINPVSRFRIIQEPLLTSLHIDQSNMEWNSVSFRLLEWKASLHELEKSWLAGVGTGDGQSALQDYYSSFNSSTVGLKYNAHNQYLQTALELGLTGLLLLLICIFKPIFTAIQHYPIHVAFVILFGLMCCTESVLARQKGIIFFTMFQSLFLKCTPS